MFDLIINKYPNFRKKLLKTSICNKRLVLLGLIDKNRLSYIENRKLIKNGNFKWIENIGEIKTYLDFHSEINTPLTLVDDILNKLPLQIWENPNLKWLDASNGTGDFLLIVIRNLMKGLKKWEPSKKERYRHIIENMIYASGNNSMSLFLYQCVIDIKSCYKTNIYYGEFLNKDFDLHQKQIWKINKFDIIVGNPPYNKGLTATGNSLWNKYILKNLNILNTNGYLAMITPSGWRKPQSAKSTLNKVSMEMMSKQIHYLEMHNQKDGLKTFNKGTRYDMYILENCKPYTDTLINDESRLNTKVFLKDYSFIPNKDIAFIEKIIAKNDDEKCPYIYDRSAYGADRNYVSSTIDTKHKYPLVHTTPKKGNRFLYSSLNDKGHFGISKIIFGDSGIYDVIIDMSGDYGMTQHARGIKVDSLEEAENIKKALLSKKFKLFIESVMWSNYQLDPNLLYFFKKDFWKEFI